MSMLSGAISGMDIYRRVVAGVVAILLFLSLGTAVSASDAGEDDLSPEEKAALEEQEQVYNLPIQSNELTGWPQGPATYGDAAIVMEAGTGAVLYAKNIEEHFYPASITKLLTVLVALENGQLGDAVTFSYDSIAFLEPGDANIGMREGDVITLEQALYAVLLASANEVSYAVGESVGKNAGHDYNWFLEQMNLRCRELGAENSNFTNTNGLHDDNHYTCAKDMALISRELFKHPEFFTIVQTLEYKIPASETTQEHVFQQNHKMMYEQNDNYYPYVIAGKTGYTDQSRTTLVTMADNGEMQLICVLLKTRGGKFVYPDTRNLLEYAFGNFKKVNVSEQPQPEEIQEILPDETGGYVLLPDGIGFEKLNMEILPDETADRQASLTYTYEGNYVGRARAVLGDAYYPDEEEEEQEEQKAPAEKKKEKKPEKGKRDKVILAASVVLLVILVAAFTVMIIRRRRKSR